MSAPANTLEHKVLQHLQVTHAAMDTAAAELTKTAAEKQAYEARIPEAVEALVKHQRIDPSRAKEAAEALKDPLRMVEVLLKTADPANVIGPKPLGTKTAGAAPAGQRESDAAFARALGL